MLDLDAVNADPMLRDTPLGDLKVIMWGGEPAVAIINRHDPDAFPRVVHMVAEGGILAAMYGRRFWEQREVRAAYERKEERRIESAASVKADRNADIERDFVKAIRKEGARDAFLQAVAAGAR